MGASWQHFTGILEIFFFLQKVVSQKKTFFRYIIRTSYCEDYVSFFCNNHVKSTDVQYSILHAYWFNEIFNKGEQKFTIFLQKFREITWFSTESKDYAHTLFWLFFYEGFREINLNTYAKIKSLWFDLTKNSDEVLIHLILLFGYLIWFDGKSTCWFLFFKKDFTPCNFIHYLW